MFLSFVTHIVFPTGSDILRFCIQRVVLSARRVHLGRAKSRVFCGIYLRSSRAHRPTSQIFYQICICVISASFSVWVFSFSVSLSWVLTSRVASLSTLASYGHLPFVLLESATRSTLRCACRTRRPYLGLPTLSPYPEEMLRGLVADVHSVLACTIDLRVLSFGSPRYSRTWALL